MGLREDLFGIPDFRFYALADEYSGVVFWESEGLRRLQPDAKIRKYAAKPIRPLKLLGKLQDLVTSKNEILIIITR